MSTHHHFKRIEYTDPEDLQNQLLTKLDLSKLHELWEPQEVNSAKEFLLLEGKDVIATISKATNGDQRGLFEANLFPSHGGVKVPKGWPRFFFDHYRAKCEVEAWLVFNGQIAIPEQNKTKAA